MPVLDSSSHSPQSGGRWEKEYVSGSWDAAMPCADPSHFAAARFEAVGPDGRLTWDQAPKSAVYLSHLDDSVVATSNAGAAVHAYSIKAVAPSFGFDENGNEYKSLAALQGKNVPGSSEGATILEEAIAADRPTAVINSGFIAESGMGVFLADAVNRGDRPFRST